MMTIREELTFHTAHVQNVYEHHYLMIPHY